LKFVNETVDTAFEKYSQPKESHKDEDLKPKDYDEMKIFFAENFKNSLGK
jgi:hypothetical protein